MSAGVTGSEAIGHRPDEPSPAPPRRLEEIEAGMRPSEVGILLGREAAGAGGMLRLVADYEARKTAYVLNGTTSTWVS